MSINKLGAAALAALFLVPLSGAQAAGGKAVATEKDRATLQRLLKRHSRYRAGLRITPGVRAATGDPNIAVFDHRGGSSNSFFQCSYITVRGKRALTCD